MKKVLLFILAVFIFSMLGAVSHLKDNKIKKPSSNIIENESPKSDLIRVNMPSPNEAIQSPLEITGEARGFWFFEASFPVTLKDLDGNILVQHYATAEGEWMTTEFVPFSTSLSFEVPEGVTNGILIFEKDNPSGLPEHDNAFIIPVLFKK